MLNINILSIAIIVQVSLPKYGTVTVISSTAAFFNPAKISDWGVAVRCCGERILLPSKFFENNFVVTGSFALKFGDFPDNLLEKVSKCFHVF